MRPDERQLCHPKMPTERPTGPVAPPPSQRHRRWSRPGYISLTFDELEASTPELGIYIKAPLAKRKGV